VAITEDAREVLPLLWNIVGESLREALTGLSTKETSILAKALHRVVANLSALDRLSQSGALQDLQLRRDQAHTAPARACATY
jgi:hypothetical protein